MIDYSELQKVGDAIQALVDNYKMDYIEAALHYAEVNKLEIEYVADIVSHHDLLKAKVTREAEDLNFIKRFARLPFTSL